MYLHAVKQTAGHPTDMSHLRAQTELLLGKKKGAEMLEMLDHKDEKP